MIAFFIVNAILWYFTYAGKENEPFVYPWPIWITAAWGLLVVGHALYDMV
ncbi:MAG: 2TM domain-containing protein [Taibaiella sp.]|nr:2TM domain-containing protein [Taibaiella sp.]